MCENLSATAVKLTTPDDCSDNAEYENQQRYSSNA